MKFSVMNSLIVIVGSLVSVNAIPIFSYSTIDEVQELTSENLTTEPSKEVSHKWGIENGANETDHTSFGRTATLQQKFPAFANDSQLPLTNAPDTNWTIPEELTSDNLTTEPSKEVSHKWGIENGANETDHTSFGSTATLQQKFPAFADDSQLPLTNAPDTNWTIPEELTSDNLTTGPSKEVSHKWGIQRHSMQENISPLSKEKEMRYRSPVDRLCNYLTIMSYDYLIKKRVHWFTLISQKIAKVEKYLGFDSVTTTKDDLSIHQTHGDVEARRKKLTMDLLLELYPTSGPFVWLLCSSHEQLKNQTYIDELKPALSNLRIKVDRLKTFNEEEKQIQKNISSTIIANISSSTMAEEIRKMKVKKPENGPNETDLIIPSLLYHYTLHQIYPAFADDSQLPLTDAPDTKRITDDSQLPLTNATDTNGISKKIDGNSAGNDTMLWEIIAGVCGGLVILLLGTCCLLHKMKLLKCWCIKNEQQAQVHTA
ncbi:hypothetical protein QYM36_008557 [Artemia franciscana]|uniref:Uncharacterized protein n=1 Tax=Artemia franciscana TaxID=6661 RepID=A0AA88LF22_ARTSF|nr:hypothetical protein QYM36_008557 [Artemia franciscana]